MIAFPTTKTSRFCINISGICPCKKRKFFFYHINLFLVINDDVSKKGYNCIPYHSDNNVILPHNAVDSIILYQYSTRSKHYQYCNWCCYLLMLSVQWRITFRVSLLLNMIKCKLYKYQEKTYTGTKKMHLWQLTLG